MRASSVSSAPEGPVASARGGGRRPGLAHHFDSHEQQREAATLGVWVFLVTEVLFFGGLFLAYAVYRLAYPEVFRACSNHLDLVLGTVNTAVLLTSSLTIALAARAAQTGSGRLAAVLLVATAVLGSLFLAIKYQEYGHKWAEGLAPGRAFRPDVLGLAGSDRAAAQIFFFLYFGMTGLHALHMVIGIGLLLGLVIPCFVGRFGPEDHNFVEGTALYWHFVDVVWLFLFPLLYLVGRHG